MNDELRSFPSKVACAHLAIQELASLGCDHEDRLRILERGVGRGRVLANDLMPVGRVLVVGATPRDIEAATAIGAVCIAVAPGDHGVDELASAGATLAVPTPEEPSVLAALVGSLIRAKALFRSALW